MTRPLRIEYPGAVYHVTSRGNARGDIFGDDLPMVERNQRIELAHERHGYRLIEIAQALSLHYTTISKVINRKRN